MIRCHVLPDARYMVKFYADLLQLSRSVFVSLAYQLFVAEPVIMLFRVMVFHRLRDRIKKCIATRVPTRRRRHVHVQ